MVLYQHRVLVLNSSYEAINICTARRALLMMLAEKADLIESSPARVHSETLNIPLPEVIRLKRYVRLPHRPIPFCRKNIMLRDGFRCQYCGSSFKPEELTLDHVIPVSRGGADSWNNVVTACKKCNHKKGNHLLEHIGMHLLNPPKRPTLPTYIHLVRLMGERREVWRKYLYFDDDESMKATV
ncbi:MAG: HNH endonuclease [bacterium]|nr:HNH endonuclease [bacterium]